MGHSQHTNSEGANIPSVSAIPKIYHQDMSGFYSWICKNLHTKEEKCCQRAASEYYEDAANLGTDIHSLREAFLRGESFAEGVPEYQAKVFEPVARFYKESGYTPLEVLDMQGADNSEKAIELKMTGKEFGGTLDGAGTFSRPFWKEERKTFYDKYSINFISDTEEFPDKILPTVETVWIEDLKIKSKLDKLHPLQLYGYSLLLKETYGIDAPWGLIIRREKKIEKSPELQLKAYYLPAYASYWDASMLMHKFLND